MTAIAKIAPKLCTRRANPNWKICALRTRIVKQSTIQTLIIGVIYALLWNSESSNLRMVMKLVLRKVQPLYLISILNVLILV